MQKQISPKIIALTFGVLVISFLAVFYVVAWTEPGQPPPGCTAGQPGCDAPINVSTSTQYKAGALGIGGVLRTYSNLVATGDSTNPVGGVCPSGYDWYDDGDGVIENGECFITSLFIQSNGNVGIGTTNPGVQLEVAGQLKITGGSPAAGRVLTSDASGLASWQTAAGGASGEYGYHGYVTITYLAGASNSCGSPQCQSVGVGVLCRKTTYYNPLGYYETGWEATCDGGYSGPYLLYNSAYNNYVTCEKSLYACIKTPFRGPGCGDGVVQGGEVCDDGNQVNDIGNCNANCSKVNYFGYPTKFVVDGNYYISINTQTTDKYCQEQGFTATLRSNAPLLTSPVARWNGSVWEKLSLGNFYYVIDLWCQ